MAKKHKVFIPELKPTRLEDLTRYYSKKKAITLPYDKVRLSRLKGKISKILSFISRDPDEVFEYNQRFAPYINRGFGTLLEYIKLGKEREGLLLDYPYESRNYDFFGVVNPIYNGDDYNVGLILTFSRHMTRSGKSSESALLLPTLTDSQTLPAVVLTNNMDVNYIDQLDMMSELLRFGSDLKRNLEPKIQKIYGEYGDRHR
jgi:hypothetical protein